MVNGYNISLKIGGKTIVGRTQDDLTIAATVKESLDKDDQGTKRFTVTGHEVSFKVSAMMSVDGVASGVQKVNRDFLIDLALKKGLAAVVAVTYACENGDAYTGNAIMTNYSESSNATDDATLSADFKVTGAFTKVTTVETTAEPSTSGTEVGEQVGSETTEQTSQDPGEGINP